MSEYVAGLDIGTGFVKIATSTRLTKFPSLIATGRHLELESNNKDTTHIGYDAAKYETIKTMTLKRPVYRGIPTIMEDYISLIKYSMDQILGTPRTSAVGRYAQMVIVAGVPYAARDHSKKIREAVMKALGPKFFGLIYQARATLIHQGLEDGIVCHIGHGTTEIMAVVNGKIASGLTLDHGVGDITSAITDTKTGYVKEKSLFAKDTPELSQYRKLLADSISDSLTKTVIDFPELPVILAGGGALIPKLVSEIKNEAIRDKCQIARDPVFSNALGMLTKAQKWH